MNVYGLGVALSFMAVAIAINWMPKTNKGMGWRAFTCYVMIFAGVLMIAFGMEARTYKSALDGRNPYEKVYLKMGGANNSLVIVDSLYLKIK